MNKFKLISKNNFLIIVVSLFLMSCGGAKGGSSTDALQVNPDARVWQDMIWDTDDWG